MFRRRVTIQYPEQKPYLAAALARPHHPVARSGRRRALRRVLPVRGRLPGRLHRAAGDRGRARPALPGVLPHQLLALHLLRLLRGGVPDLRDPAHARFRDERVHRQNLVYEKEDLLIDGPGKYPGYNFYRVAGVAIGGKDKGEAEQRSATGRRADPAAVRSHGRHLLRRRRRRHRRHGCWRSRQQNAVHALLYLIVSLLAVAVVFLALGAPFVAALEVIIYAGAIMVLFVFVMMMLNLGPRTVEQERALAARRASGSARSC